MINRRRVGKEKKIFPLFKLFFRGSSKFITFGILFSQVWSLFQSIITLFQLRSSVLRF